MKKPQVKHRAPDKVSLAFVRVDRLDHLNRSLTVRGPGNHFAGIFLDYLHSVAAGQFLNCVRHTKNYLSA